MLIDDNGVIREITESDKQENDDILLYPTLEERINAVESAMLEIISGGKINV